MNENKKFKELSIRDRLAYIFCTFAFFFGALLTILGFWTPPIGEVSGSVISIIGIFLSYSAAVLGIGLHYETELGKIKSSLLSNNADT